jgi:anti-sigma regulatory factor (Ser/Thr protein kinase)
MDRTDPEFDLSDVVVADRCHLRIRSRPEVIAATVDYLVGRATQCGAVRPAQTSRVMMALHEALTNAVIHGNLGVSSDLKEHGDHAFVEAVTARCADPGFADRVVDIQASYDGESARWVFTDQGAGFDVERILGRLEADGPDPTRPSGRGLLIMRAFVDEMSYDQGGRRLTLTLRKAPEKRSCPRLPIVQGLSVAPIDGDGLVHPEASRQAMARDISEQGIGFLQAQLVESARVMITIPTPGEPISLPATVRHCRQVGDLVEVGCRFDASFPGPDSRGPTRDPGLSALYHLLDRLAAKQQPSEERRRDPRLPYTECISVQLADHAPLRGFARDLSRGGIAFFTTANLPCEAVGLSLPPGESAPAVHVRAQVIRCTRLMDGFYDVAARFMPG